MSFRTRVLKLRMPGTMGSIRRFAREERGIVAVEWVAITGAVVAGSILAVWFLTNSLNTPASSISGNLADCETWASATSSSITGCQ